MKQYAPETKIAKRQSESLERRNRVALAPSGRNSIEARIKPTLAANNNGDFYIYKLECLNLQKVLEKEKAEREVAQYEVQVRNNSIE